MLIETERLRLRDWRDTDLDALGAVNADPQVAYWLARDPTDTEANRASFDHWRRMGVEQRLTLWPVETLDGQFLGACGLVPVMNNLPVRPGVEIGWRLPQRHWGHGYATEAARAVLAHAWSIGLPEVLAFTAQTNIRSRAVMERLGMVHEPDCDFAHPRLSPSHPLLDHVLYSIRRPA